MHYSVLIIDDEKELSEYTSRYFNMSGVSAYYVLDAGAARDFLEKNSCSLVLLDINLGDDSGFELCQEIRRNRDIPIFFISARAAEDDMLLALSIGGDDYICKPYSLGVLLAKVKAELKRYEAANAGAREKEDSDIVKMGDVRIDLKKAVVSKGDKEYPLKATEYKILVYMLRHSERVIPKEEFFKQIWDTEFVGDVTLNVHIRHLREKIEDDPGNPKFIKTVWGVGFMLEKEP